MTATVADIRLHSSLIEDYQYIQDPPLVLGSPGSFVAVQDLTMGGGPAAPTHLLAIGDGGDLLHFAPDRHSVSGWRVTVVPIPVPPGAEPTLFSITAFYAAGGLNALCLFPMRDQGGPEPIYAVTWMWRKSPGCWADLGVSMGQDVRGLLSSVAQAEVYVDAAGNPFVYGVATPPLGRLPGGPGYLDPDSAMFFILGRDPGSGAWTVAAQTTSGAMGSSAPLQLRVLPGEANPVVLWMDQQGVAWRDLDLVNSAGGRMAWAGALERLPYGAVAPSGILRLLPVPDDVAPHSVLFVDGENNLQFAQFDETFPSVGITPLTGAAALPANAPAGVLAVCLSGDAQIFILESGTGLLWTCKSYNNFATWSPLGNRLGAIAARPNASAAPALFVADLNNRIFHLAKNAGDTIWVMQSLAVPNIKDSAADPPAPIASITVQAAAVDARSNPVPGALFTLASDQWVHLVVQAQTHWVGPGADALVASDSTGTISVMHQAQGLTMPKLAFSAINPASQSAADPASGRWCQGDVVERKAGETVLVEKTASAASRLAGTDPTFPVTATTLAQQGFTDIGSGSDSVLPAIASMGQWMVTQSTKSGPSAGQSRPVASQHGLSAPEADKSLGALGGIWDDVGDALNHLKHAWEDVTSIAATVVGDAIEIAVNGVKLVVTEVRQAAAVMELVFVRMANGLRAVYDVIKEVVEWLMLLFEWKDIVNTHLVMKAMINSLFDAAQGSAEGLKALLNQKWSGLRASMDSALSTVGSNPALTQSFNQFANGLPQKGGAPGPAGSNVLANPRQHGALQNHMSQCLYAYNHARDCGIGDNALRAAPGAGSPSSDLSGLVTAIETAWDRTAFNGLATNFGSYMTSNHGGYAGLLDFAISELVTAIKGLLDLAMQGIEAVFDALFDVIADVIGLVQTWAKHTIDIPVISWLYSSIAQQPFSILDLFCLVCAVPVTVLYKVLCGSAPFRSGEANGLTLPWPRVGPAALRAAPLASLPPAFYKSVGVCGAVLNLFSIVITPALDYEAFNGSTPPSGEVKLLSWISVFLGAATLAMEAPYALWVKLPAHQWSDADIMTTTLWSLQGLSAFIDLVFTWFSDVPTRFVQDGGPICDSALGAAIVGWGIATGSVQLATAQGEGYTGWDAANSILPQLYRPFRFLLLDKDPDTKEFSCAALLLIDAAVIIGGTLTQFVDTMEG